MSGNRYIRRGTSPMREPKFGRMLLISLGLHLLLFIIFSGALVFNSERDQRPVYYVDLTQMPVANPQAGRPDARPKATKKPVTKPEKKPTVKRVPVKPVVKPTVKQAPVKPDVKTSQPQPESVKRQVNDANNSALQKKLAAMQREQVREELKQKLAALASGDSREEDTLAPDVPLGEPDAQGDEAGSSYQTYLKAFVTANWSLSLSQVRNVDAETKVRVVYSRSGQLVNFEVLTSSGESRFDDSIKKAILKEMQLPFEPPQDNWTQDITFNLKDLLDQ
jgi:colicin import membrane protein